jgi:antitoxin CptB
MDHCRWKSASGWAIVARELAGVENMTESIQDQALRWRSRRGALELELLLLPFVTTRLAGLASEAKARYARLLDYDDWDIYDWIQGRGDPPEADLREIIALVRSANVR